MKAPKCTACEIEFVPSETHSRAGEIPTPMICACCGEFVDGTPEEIAACRAAWERCERVLVADEARARAEARVVAAGGIPGQLPARRQRVEREQLDLFATKGAS